MYPNFLLNIHCLLKKNKLPKGTVIAITHDRYFLDNVAGWILELDRGEGIPWKGNYSSWLEQKTKRLAQEEKTESKRRKTLERELSGCVCHRKEDILNLNLV